MERELLSILIGVLSITVMIIIIHLINLKKYKVLKNLSSHFNGSVKIFLIPTFIGSYQGTKFRILLTPQSRNSPPYLKFLLYAQSPFKLTIVKEISFHKFFKKIGLLHEMKVNDPEFDKNYFIRSNDKGRGLYLLNNNEVKNAIYSLFNLGFDRLSISHKGITTQKPNYKLDLDLPPENVTKLLNNVMIVRNGLLQIG